MGELTPEPCDIFAATDSKSAGTPHQSFNTSTKVVCFPTKLSSDPTAQPGRTAAVSVVGRLAAGCAAPAASATIVDQDPLTTVPEDGGTGVD